MPRKRSKPTPPLERTDNLPPNWTPTDEEWAEALRRVEEEEAIRDEKGNIVPTVFPMNDI